MPTILALSSRTQKETPTVGQELLWPEAGEKTPLADVTKRKARSGTFIDNHKLPVHRWFRYSAGFSAEWVQNVLRSRGAKRVFDPFAGSGTTLLAADSLAIPSVGTESHPFVARIAEAKLAWDFDVAALRAAAAELRAKADSLPSPPAREADSLIPRIYAPAVLDTLERMRLGHAALADSWPPATTKLLWLVITNLLRACSHAGTAQWQYVLPNKSKAAGKSREPWAAFELSLLQLVSDRSSALQADWQSLARVVLHDARAPFDFPTEGPFDAVLTSPPYPNNYDYADATRLEMTFWKEISGWGDLQGKVRRHLMRSCSQHAAAERLRLEVLLADSLLVPIRQELSVACAKLAEIRETKGGKKAYHTMAAAYFADLARVFHNLRVVTAPGACVCFVIGDSAPYGVHLPAERWLGELAVSAGFHSWRFEKLRDRNVKWDNRVHDVPLHEGNLWIEG